MWDEQERFAERATKAFTSLLGIAGVALTAISVATGDPDPFYGFLMMLGVVATFTLGYGLVALIVGAMLFGVASGAAFRSRRIRGHRSRRPSAGQSPDRRSG
jgi:uncharacterized membrane protein